MKAALQCIEWRKKGRSCFHELRWSRHSQEVQCALCRGRARPQAARGSDRGQLGLRFRSIFASLEGASKAVVEACWNWGLVHDELEEIEQVEEVVLAHPYKTRLIADAQIKTDRLDAHALGTLLRGNPSGARPCAAPPDASAQKSAAA